MIDEEKRWPRCDEPVLGDILLSSLNGFEGAPTDFGFLKAPLEYGWISITIDAKYRERLSFVALHERPLVRDHCHAWASPEAPEVQEDNLAAVIREFKKSISDIATDYFRS